MPPKSTAALLAAARACRAQAQSATPSRTRDENDNPGSMASSGRLSSPLLLPSSPAHLDPNFSFLSLPPSGSSARRKAFGERTTKRLCLDGEAAAELTRFVETTDKEEQSILLAGYLLKVSAGSSQSTAIPVAQWEPPQCLQEWVMHIQEWVMPFCWAVLLLPNTQYYLGTIEKAIIDAMRKAKIPGLPDADSLEHPVFVRHLGKAWIQARYQLKKAVVDSLKTDHENRNIAALSEFLVAHVDGLNITFGLYLRLTLIRRHVQQKHSPDDFWPAINKELDELRAEGPEAFIETMKIIYEEDIQKFGKPEDTTITIGEGVTSGSPKWLRLLSDEVGKIKLMAKKRQGKGKKRKHAAMTGEGDEAPDNEEPEHEGLGDSNEVPPGGAGSEDETQ